MKEFEKIYGEYNKTDFCIYPSPDEGDHLNYDPRFEEFCDDWEIDADDFAEFVKKCEGWGDYA